MTEPAAQGVPICTKSTTIPYWAVLVYLPLFLNAAFGWTPPGSWHGIAGSDASDADHSLLWWSHCDSVGLALAPPEVSGMASAVAVIARQGGFAIGVAALGGLLPPGGAAAGFLWLFCVAAAASACGALACLLLPPASGNSMVSGSRPA
jgi:hypothetical protein